MSDVKVTVELEIDKNFKPCENEGEIYIKGDCPFSWYHYDDGCQVCNYNIKECPMRTMKEIKTGGVKIHTGGDTR